MKLPLRALLAVSMLAGVLVVIVASVAGVAIGARAIVDDSQRSYGAFRIALFALLLALAATWTLIRSLIRRTGPEPGVVLTRADQPRLWDEVDALARLADTRGPDVIRLVGEANAAVVEDVRPFRRSRRTLLLGAPLLVGLEHGQLRAVLAHELAHFSARHTTSGRITHRGQEILGDLIHRIGPRTLVGRAIDLYGRLYLRVAGEVSRRQELEADRFAAEVSGASTAADAVATLPDLAAAWHHFLRGDVLHAEERGKRPEQMLLVFGQLWRNPASRAAIESVMSRYEPPPSPYDTHPSTDARVAHLRGLDREDLRVVEATPALEPLVEPGATLGALEDRMYEGSELVPTPWDQLVAERAAADAAGAARQLGWSAQQEKLADDATVGALLDLVEAGHGPRIAGRFMDATASLAQRQRALAQLLRRALEHALVQRHGLRHVPGEDGEPVLRAADGTPVPPPELVHDAARAPTSVAPLRDWAEDQGLLARPLAPG